MFVSVSMSWRSLWTCWSCWSCWSWFTVLPMVVSSAFQDEVKALVGDNVTLPCWTPVAASVRAAEWTRTDLVSEYVFFYRNQQPDFSFQHYSFLSRVALADPQLTDGNVSLVLRNSSDADSGTYMCRVHQGTTSRKRRAVIKSEPICIISLTVSDPDRTTFGGAAGRLLGHVSLSLVLSLFSAVLPGL